MKVVARRREGFAHDVEIEGGHTLRVDEPTAAGGTDTGPSPTRLVAAGLAGCTAITMEMYAERKGWDVGAGRGRRGRRVRDVAPLSVRGHPAPAAASSATSSASACWSSPASARSTGCWSARPTVTIADRIEAL